MGFDVEASHHEVAPGQHEVDFKYADALHACDNIQTFKLVVKTVARSTGCTQRLCRSHWPRSTVRECTSTCHCSRVTRTSSLMKRADQLSDEARWFLGGLLKHARNFTAITNPIVNSTSG